MKNHLSRHSKKRLADLAAYPWCVKPLKLYAGINIRGKRCDLPSSSLLIAPTPSSSTNATASIDSVASATALSEASPPTPPTKCSLKHSMTKILASETSASGVVMHGGAPQASSPSIRISGGAQVCSTPINEQGQ